MNSLNCIGCGRIAQTKDLVITVRASAGPRVNVSKGTPLWSHSPYPTVTKNAVICDHCLQAPEMRVVIELISAPYSEVEMIAGGHCVVICRGRREPFWFAGVRRRVRLWPRPEAYRCPSCHRLAAVWVTPLVPDRYIRELEGITDPNRRAMIRTRGNVAATLARRPLPAPGDEQ